MTRYFIHPRGNYIGGFDGADPPVGAIEIAAPPKHGLDKWDFNAQAWLPYVPPLPLKTKADKILIALVAKGVIKQADVDAIK